MHTHGTTVHARRRMRRLAPGVLALAMGACGESSVGPPAQTVATVTVTSPIDTVMMQSRTVQLSAAARNASGGTVSGVTLTWASSNTAVASVTTAGAVTGVTAGVSEISATAEGVAGSLRMRVVVTDAAAIETVLDDPLVSRLLMGASAAPRATVSTAVDSVRAAVGTGNVMVMHRNLAAARAAAGAASEPDDRAVLAVLDLLLAFAQARVGL